MNRLFLNILGIIFPLYLFAQDKADQKQVLIDQYIQEAGDCAALYHNPIETPYNPAAWINDPYWGTADCQPGSVIYDNILYKNVSLRFNAVTQQLLVSAPNTGFLVCPNMDLIPEFTMGGKLFIKQDGKFMSREYDGKCLSFWDKKVKYKTQDVIERQRSYKCYKEEDTYLLFYNDQYTQVKRIKDLYKQFPTYAKRLKKYVRESEITLRLERAAALTDAISTLDSYLAGDEKH